MPSGNAPLTSYLSQGTLSNYEPSWRDRAAYWLAQNWYGDDREGVQKANRLMNVADVTPVGIPLALDDAARSFGRGNYLGGGITLAMAGIPAARKEAKLTGEAAKKTLDAILEKHGLTPPKTIRAYHGSPHSFDKFSMDKIGTGEGAQAYGHGLYFSETEDVAKSYRDTLGGLEYTVDGKPVGVQGKLKDNPKALAAYFMEEGRGYDGAIERLNLSVERHKSGNYGTSPSLATKIKAELDGMKNAKVGTRPAGSMYEVQINANPDDFLDWDKPLSEQPHLASKGLPIPDPNQSGADFYNNLDPYTGRLAVLNRIIDGGGAQADAAMREKDEILKLGESASSKVLSDKGIPGIKYLDQGSRAKGDGSRNYVVFDDRLITILRKYGLLPPIAGAAAYGARQNQEQPAY